MPPPAAECSFKEYPESTFVGARFATFGNAFELSGVPEDFHNPHAIHSLDIGIDWSHLLIAVAPLQQCRWSVRSNGQQSCQTGHV